MEMDENKDQPKRVSSCFEGAAFAELVQRVLGREGVGSLCAEMMRSLTKRGHEAPAGRPGAGPDIDITGGKK